MIIRIIFGSDMIIVKVIEIIFRKRSFICEKLHDLKKFAGRHNLLRTNIYKETNSFIIEPAHAVYVKDKIVEILIFSRQKCLQ